MNVDIVVASRRRTVAVGSGRISQGRPSSRKEVSFLLPGNLFPGQVKRVDHASTVELLQDLTTLDRRLDNGLTMARIHTTVPDGHALLFMDNDIAGEFVPANMRDEPDLNVALTITIDVLGTEDALELLLEDGSGDTAALVTLAMGANHNDGTREPLVGQERRVAGLDGADFICSGVVMMIMVSAVRRARGDAVIRGDLVSRSRGGGGDHGGLGSVLGRVNGDGLVRFRLWILAVSIHFVCLDLFLGHFQSLGLCLLLSLHGGGQGTHGRSQKGLKEIMALVFRHIVDNNLIGQDHDLPSFTLPAVTVL